MSEFFRNVWTKRVVSLLGLVYTAGVAWYAYMSVFYSIIVTSPTQLCVMLSAVSMIALILMLYTREQFLTKLSSLLLLPLMLMPVLMYFGQWGILIPPLVCALIIFFFSGLGETAKTIWGTVFLLLYLLGSLLFFVVTSMFAPSTVTTVRETGESLSGLYRYTVSDTVDSSNGSTKVSVESSAMDQEYDMAIFRIKGLSRDVVLERPLNDNVNIEWTTENRQDITSQINAISKDIEITLSDQQMDLLNRPAYQVTYPDGRSISLMQSDYYDIVITLTEEEMEMVKAKKSELKLSKISDKSKEKLGYTVENFRTIKLSSLTDDDLAALGVPEQGDVMYYNGRCVFRYYIAVLEEYFDLSKQDLGLF